MTFSVLKHQNTCPCNAMYLEQQLARHSDYCTYNACFILVDSVGIKCTKTKKKWSDPHYLKKYNKEKI